MSYPAEHRNKQKRALVRIARDLFNRKGFDAVSIEEIMAGLGLTGGGFYSYFSSKSELYAVAVGAVLAERPVSQSELAASDAARDLIRGYDARFVATADLAGTVWVWSLLHGKPVAKLNLSGPAIAVAFSADGGRLLTCGRDFAAVWDLAAQQQVTRFEWKGPNPITGATFASHDSALILANVRAVRALTLSSVHEVPFQYHERWPVILVASSPNGMRAVTSNFGSRELARLWDVNTGQELMRYPNQSEELISTREGSTEDSNLLMQLPQAGREWKDWNDEWTSAAVFSSDGSRVLIAKGHEAIVWDFASNRTLVRIPLRGQVKAATLFQDGRRILTSSQDSTLQTWDTAALTLPTDVLADRICALIPESDRRFSFAEANAGSAMSRTFERTEMRLCSTSTQ